VPERIILGERPIPLRLLDDEGGGATVGSGEEEVRARGEGVHRDLQIQTFIPRLTSWPSFVHKTLRMKV
jgi:hypothetical protein